MVKYEECEEDKVIKLSSENLNKFTFVHKKN